MKTTSRCVNLDAFVFSAYIVPLLEHIDHLHGGDDCLREEVI